jgi:hypothetical protein
MFSFNTMFSVTPQTAYLAREMIKPFNEAVSIHSRPE